MAKKPSFEDLFDAAAAEFESAFRRTATSSRPDEIGEERERHLRAFLQEWLPTIYGVSHGYVIDIQGGMSRQCDVIFYDAPRCPKFLLDRTSDRRLVPFASTYGTIEVKSTLGEAELADALQKLESVSRLKSAPSQLYVSSPQYAEYDVLALEDEEAESSWRLSARRRYVRDSDWTKYRVKVLQPEEERTHPLGLIFAYRFARGLSFDRVQEVCEAAKYHPDGIVVLDAGFSFYLTAYAVKRFKSLSTGKPAAHFDLDGDVMEAMFANRGRSYGQAAEYLTQSESDPKVTLLFFYAYLMDLLSMQYLVDSAESRPTDFLAVWRRHR